MATKKGSSESGKLGNKIYYTWHGRQCERSMPTSVANPRTEAQQAHRSNFAIVSKLSSYMKAAHLVGLHWHALREHNSTYAIFRNTNKDCFTPDGKINLARVIVSYGTVEQVEITSATIDKNVLTVTFDSRVYGGKATDEFFLFVYSSPPSSLPNGSNPSQTPRRNPLRQSRKPIPTRSTSTPSSAPPAPAPPTPSTSP